MQGSWRSDSIDLQGTAKVCEENKRELAEATANNSALLIDEDQEDHSWSPQINLTSAAGTFQASNPTLEVSVQYEQRREYPETLRREKNLGWINKNPEMRIWKEAEELGAAEFIIKAREGVGYKAIVVTREAEDTELQYIESIEEQIALLKQVGVIEGKAKSCLEKDTFDGSIGELNDPKTGRHIALGNGY